MTLSRQEEIGILLVCTIAQHVPDIVPLSKIAHDHAISVLFLKKIARFLKKAGIIESKEGTGGGYILAKDPISISVLGICNAVSQKKSNRSVLITGPVRCPVRPACLPQNIRFLISETLMQYLSDMTLDQLIKERST